MRSFFSKLSTLDESSLTNNEKKLVAYIKEHSSDIVETNMKIEKLAQEISTGYSAIYTLLKKLRFQGYKDFLMSLSNDYELRKYDINENDEEITKGYINVIRKNHNLIEKRSLFETINYIRQASRIFICNWETVLLSPAIELANYFYKLRFNSILLTQDQEIIVDRAQSATKDDLFIFYTKYGTSTRLRSIIKLLNEVGAKVIVISGKVIDDPDIRIDSAHYLMVDTHLEFGLQTNFANPVPFHYFNDLLIFHYNSKFSHQD